MNALLPNNTIEQARRVNVVALVERYSQLEKASRHEWKGPCPKCGGTKRLRVKEDSWFCRHCKPIDPIHGWHNAIDFVLWMQPGLSFADAVAQLTGGDLPPTTQRLPERKQRDPHPLDQDAWQRRATALLHQAQERLFELEGKPGQAYLEGRGLDPRIWSQFGLGYRPDVSVPGTEGKEKAPAICIPWYAGGKLVGIRYRFLQTQNGHKQTAEYGSRFGDRLFGRQGLPEWVSPANSDGKFERMCDLMICEGEINAMSIWQMAGDTNLHVLSMGSESARLSEAMITFAGRYRSVICWADRAEVARNLQMALPGASSITSPNGKDANDLLKDGLLGVFLAMARLRACRGDHQREGLLWDLWDAAQSWRGVDAGTLQAIREIAGMVGKTPATAISHS